MPKQIGVFVDVSNLYYCIGKKYKGKKLDYSKYMEYIKSFGEIVVANAYGAQIRNQASSFLYCLRQLGIVPIYATPKSFIDNGVTTKKADYDVKITVDIFEVAPKLDIIIIGSADGDFVPLIKNLLSLNKKVIVFACKISSNIHELGIPCIEIPESFLEEKKYDTIISKTG